MREIKFRAKSKKTGEWLYGDLLHNRGAVFIAPVDVENPLMADDYEIDESTIGEYTGLKDDLLNEIYEGDILKVTCYNAKLIVKSVNAIVTFDCGTFRLKLGNRNAMLLDTYVDNGIELVGNIYDNKELLESEESK